MSDLAQRQKDLILDMLKKVGSPIQSLQDVFSYMDEELEGRDEAMALLKQAKAEVEKLESILEEVRKSCDS